MEGGQALGSLRSGQGEIRVQKDDTTVVAQKPELNAEINPAVDLAKTISHGEAPSNKQLTGVIDSTKEALEAEVSHRGNAPEVKLAKHAERFLESCKGFLNEKNKDEKLQAFIKDTQQALQELQDQSKIAAQQAKEKGIDEGTKEEFKARGELIKDTALDSVRSIKALVLMLIDSYEFRSLVVDCIGWIQDIAKAEWRQVEYKAPEISKEEEKLQALQGKSLREEFSEKSQQVKEVASDIINDIADRNLPIDRYRKEDLKNRFNDLLRRFSNDDRFQRALNGVFEIFSLSYTLAGRAAEQAQSKGKEISSNIPPNEGLRKMWEDGRALVEQFSGKDELNQLFDDTREVMEVVRDDQTLQVFFRETRDYILDTFQNPDLIYDEEFQRRADRLLDLAYDWVTDPKYTDRMQVIWGDINKILENIKNDETRRRLAQDTQVLAHDLFLDETGQPSFAITQHGLNNARSLLAPILRKNLEILNFPLVAGSNKEYDWEIRDLTLNAANIVPDQIEVRLWADANIMLNEGKSKALSYLTIWIRDIGISASDVKFHFKRKTFPTIDNYGRANMKVFGNNQLRVTWKVNAQEDKPIDLKLYSLRCYIDHLKIDVLESNHKILDKLVLSLWHSNIKRSLEENVEKSVRDALFKVNVQISEALKTKQITA